MQQTSLMTERASSLTQLASAAKAGHLFAVVDACDAGWVPAVAEALGDSAASLYSGEAEETYWAIAPYVMSVDEAVLRWILDHVNPNDEAWGIFAVSPAPASALRKHFRSFLQVSSPSGEPMYFRFYDPRLLPAFLIGCVEEELGSFFGPVSEFITAGPSSRQFRCFARPSPQTLLSANRPAIRIRRSGSSKQLSRTEQNDR
jgi:hypothetical protein